jgi:hypothetical protein
MLREDERKQILIQRRDENLTVRLFSEPQNIGYDCARSFCDV